MSETTEPLPAPPTLAPDGESGASGPGGPDWTDQVADLVVDVVDKVRDRTTGPVLKVAHSVVYGIVAVIVAVPVAVLGIILIGRLLAMIPGPLWIPYAVLGGLLVLVGLILWSKRSPK